MVIMSPQLFSYKLLVTTGEWGEDTSGPFALALSRR